MKRFYQAAVAGQTQGGWQVMLDGRAVKTPGGRAQIVPGRVLAEALALEWAGQDEQIDPSRMLVRDLADYAIDVVAPDPAGAVAALLPFAETDTLCYRAEPGEALHARQQELWEPLLTQAESRWDVHFERISGVVHRAQPPATLVRMQAVLAAEDPFSLAALQTLASLAASLVVALAGTAPGADAAALWNAANLEEDWQAELWGKDAEAETQRTRRLALFAAAMHFAGLARGETG